MELYDVPIYADAFFLENICCVQDLAHINFYGDNLRILGLPSSDGTGPTANIVTSFSITAGSSVEDAAYALLDLMLSEDVQKQTRDAIPMNRAAVLAKLEKEKEINQNGYAQYLDNPESLLYDLPDLMREASIFEPNSPLPDVYLKALDSVNSVFLSDSSVMMIVSEEIPAYLLGQKDIGSVIATLNNRTKTVFDER